MEWQRKLILTWEGEKKAIAPFIISASRSTDIPAFYGEWFFHRLQEGYVKWVNPFNHKAMFISLERVRFIVFWSKNPLPFFSRLADLDKEKLGYYFQFTINDYENEGLEPNLPSLRERVRTFKELSRMLGKHRVIWRFDPLILLEKLPLSELIRRIKNIGDQIAPYTERLVFSFIDVEKYKKVKHNLQRKGFIYHKFNEELMFEAAEKIARLCKDWGIVPATCAEKIDLDKLGVVHNRCIDHRLIFKISNGDKILMNFLRIKDLDETFADNNDGKPPKWLKDKGQRPECGCIICKDIGQYNTCPHLCVYCYANSSEDIVRRNLSRYSGFSSAIVGS